MAQPTGAADAKRDSDRVGGALAEFSGEKTRLDTGGIVEPLATPESETMWVFFSYAALNADEQKIQDEFFERLKEKLSFPPGEFARLPKIEIWRTSGTLRRQIAANCSSTQRAAVRSSVC